MQTSMPPSNDAVRRAIRRALIASATAAAAVGGNAFAQDQEQEQAAAADQGNVDTVVVTGSRIPQPNLQSVSPVTVIGEEEVALSGVTRVEDLINNLPQAFADFGGNLSNGATGAATVSLRNLGAQRTLVLVNGRRLMPGDPTQNGNSAPDLNQIPAALIKRVEVLTGGASAVYGADAVAGVVNFIMEDSFEGVKLDAQYSFYQHENDNAAAEIVRNRGFALPEDNVTDGYTKDITGIIGVNTDDGRGNATLYAGYRELDAVTQDLRDYSACTLNPDAAQTGLICGGSGTIAAGRFWPSNQTTGAPIGAGFTLQPNNSFAPYNALTDAYNFAPTNYYQRPDERWTAGVFGRYEVNSRFESYAEFMFMDDQTVAQIAPSGAFAGSGPINGAYIVNCANPFLNAQQRQLLCFDQGLTINDDALVGIGKRNVEGGGRQSDFRHTSYRGVIGGRGEITAGWTYDVSGQYGTTNFSQTYLNDFSSRRLSNALLAVNGPNGPVCRINVDATTTNDDPNCAPYNIFQNGGVTPAALNYVQVPGFQDGKTIEQIVTGSVTGDLGQYNIKLPWAEDGVGIAFGAEYRSEESSTRNDVSFSSGDLLGQGGATLNIQGEYDVTDFFFEGRVPISQDQPFARQLSFETGYRYSDYSLGFDTDTYKFGLDWAPVDDVRLRSSYQRAVRAPNIVELFRPSVVQLDGTQDPCANNPINNALPSVANPLATAANCARTGVLPGQYGNIIGNSAQQYNGLTGGNPDLDPESADTIAFGFVVTPRFLENLSVAVDYYNIKVEDVIGVVGADLIINNCLATGDPAFCNLINRAPGSGSLWLGLNGFITNTNFNLGELETSGVDLEVNYRFNTGGIGGFSFNLVGSYLEELLTTPLPGGDSYDCKGYYGVTCVISSPEWRHKLRATWETPWRFSVSATWRHIGSVDVDALSQDPLLNGAVAANDASLPAFNYIDLAGTVFITDKLVARIGVNNVTDKDPPLISQQALPTTYGNGNTLPQVYEALGRYMFLNVTATF